MSEYDDERARVAGCARAVLERTQWRNLKTRTVIKEADVSARRFYELFENEDDLALFLLEEEFERLRQTLVSELVTPPVGWGSIARFIDLYLDIFLDPSVEPRRRYYHVHMEGEGARRRFTGMRNQVLLPLEQALAAAKAMGEVDIEDPVADGQRTYNLLEGLIYFTLWADRDEDPQAVKTSVQAYVRRALGVT